MTDFNEFIAFNKPIITTFKHKELKLFHCYLYHGPVTMQALPYGGVQSLYDYQLILWTKSGFITCDEVEYDHQTMSTKKFVEKYQNELLNTVLPN